MDKIYESKAGRFVINSLIKSDNKYFISGDAQGIKGTGTFIQHGLMVSGNGASLATGFPLPQFRRDPGSSSE